MASGYNGGEGVSTANQKIIGDESIPRKYYELSFLNTQKCTVVVNNSNPIPCPEGIGFEIDSNDTPISSFVIVEPEINYIWRGKY